MKKNPFGALFYISEVFSSFLLKNGRNIVLSETRFISVGKMQKTLLLWLQPFAR